MPIKKTKRVTRLCIPELALANESYLIAGVDEAGVSPLAGPVVAGAVILDPKKDIYKLRDSKILTAEQREELFEKIKERAIAFSVGIASVEEIDTLNIYHAKLLAMQRAVFNLTKQPALVLIDGPASPALTCAVKTIVGGDQTVKAISAASIVAKVTRDKIMQDYHTQFPQYAFDKHKGYPTKEHQRHLLTFGVCPIHRRSFNRVKERLAQVPALPQDTL